MVSDLHYALPQFEWLARRASGQDVVVIAGDLLDLSSPVDLDAQILVVSRYLEQIAEEAIVVVGSGNHDGDVPMGRGDFAAEWLLDLQNPRIAVDGRTIRIGEDKWTACPWWESDDSKAAMVEMLRAEASGPRDWRRWAWVHHAPPAGCGVSWTGQMDAGDTVVRELIEDLQPDVVFSGHIHNAPFYADGSWVSRVGRSWIFNPGRQIGPVPAAVFFDSGTMVAEYRSLETKGRAVLD